MTPHVEKRLLQAALLLLAFSPLGVGALGMLGGLGFGEVAVGEVGVNVASHARYLSGIFFTLGVLLLTLVPNIEREGRVFGWLCAAVIVGGLARLAAVASDGWPSWPFQSALVLELVVTPLMWAWQRRLARRHAPVS